ncbi:pyruvate, phosphate dikinase [Tanacetum coccineum]
MAVSQTDCVLYEWIIIIAVVVDDTFELMLGLLMLKSRLVAFGYACFGYSRAAYLLLIVVGENIPHLGALGKLIKLAAMRDLCGFAIKNFRIRLRLSCWYHWVVASDGRFVKIVMRSGFADEHLVTANADTPNDALTARNNGGQWIGLCRYEHMATSCKENDHGRRPMDGFPVTIRLLDPPLHEFLPGSDLEQIVGELTKDTGMTKDEIYSRIEKLSEVNPKLGFRGCIRANLKLSREADVRPLGAEVKPFEADVRPLGVEVKPFKLM